MADQSRQDLLREAWHGGRAGTFSASAQARIWAIREEWRDAGKSLHGLNAHVGRVVAAYTFDAGSNAFVFSEPQHTALVNAVIAHFFPGENSPKKRTRLDVGVCMAELEARLKMKPLAAGTVTRLYHSKVGGGG